MVIHIPYRFHFGLFYEKHRLYIINLGTTSGLTHGRGESPLSIKINTSFCVVLLTNPSTIDGNVESYPSRRVGPLNPFRRVSILQVNPELFIFHKTVSTLSLLLRSVTIFVLDTFQVSQVPSFQSVLSEELQDQRNRDHEES